MGYTVCGECHSLGQHQQGDIITIGLHTPECSQNPKYYERLASESEKFFAAVNDGRVYLKPDVEHGNFQTIKGLRVVVIPKEVGE